MEIQWCAWVGCGQVLQTRITALGRAGARCDTIPSSHVMCGYFCVCLTYVVYVACRTSKNVAATSEARFDTAGHNRPPARYVAQAVPRQSARLHDEKDHGEPEVLQITRRHQRHDLRTDASESGTLDVEESKGVSGKGIFRGARRLLTKRVCTVVARE